MIAIQAVTQVGWDGEVNDGTDVTEGVAADGTVQHTGPCSVTMFPWDFNKPGGTGP